MEYIWMFYMIDIFVSIIRNIQLLGGQYINYFIAFFPRLWSLQFVLNFKWDLTVEPELFHATNKSNKVWQSTY